MPEREVMMIFSGDWMPRNFENVCVPVMCKTKGWQVSSTSFFHGQRNSCGPGGRAFVQVCCDTPGSNKLRQEEDLHMLCVECLFCTVL